MNNIKDIVLETYKEILEKNNSDIVPDLNNKLDRKSGLDSLGLVDFIVGIEEKSGINLDPVLVDLREAETMQDVVDLVQQVSDNKQKSR